MNFTIPHINIVDGGTCQQVAVSTTSAQSTVITPDTTFVDGPTCVLISSTVDVFVRKGVNPTALSTGVDLVLRANREYRTFIMPGEQFAFVTATGTGTVNIAPGA